LSIDVKKQELLSLKDFIAEEEKAEEKRDSLVLNLKKNYLPKNSKGKTILFSVKSIQQILKKECH